MRAKVRGTEIYFDVDGMGLVPEGPAMVERPTVFLLHGGPGGEHGGFKTQLASLTDVAQLVYIDHRGSGRSAACDPSTYTLDENVADIDALRDYLGLDRITVLGSSYGGMVAQGYAIKYTEHVSNLILSATSPSFRFMNEAKLFLEEHGSEEQIRVCQALWDGEFQSQEQLYEYYKVMGPLYSRSFDIGDFEDSWTRGIRNCEQTNIGFGGFLRTYDFTDQLGSITCPTLVMGGAHDWICPISQSHILAEKIPRAHLKVFANSAHNIAGDEPEEYLTAVRGFLTYAPV